MILGVVVLAAGVKKAVGHAFEPLALQPAVALSAGTALFFLGHAWFLHILRIRGVARRLAVAAAVLAAIPLGQVLAAAQLAALVLIMATAVIVESRTRRAVAGVPSCPPSVAHQAKTRCSGPPSAF